MSNVSMREMLDAGVHFGHQTRYWNPKMKQYIYGARNGVHIINLEKTVACFDDALNFIGNTVAHKGKVLFVGTKRAASEQVKAAALSCGQYRSEKTVACFDDALNFIGNTVAHKGKVLFVGTKRAASEQVKAAALSCGQYYVNHRWLGGMLTNWKTVKQSIKRFKELETQSTDGTFDKLTKKEALVRTRDMAKLEKCFGGIKDMGSLPDVVFVIDAEVEHIAIKEANNLGIPVVAIVDTNSCPDNVDYVVPGNDDAIRAISLYLNTVAGTVNDARESVTTAQVQEVPAEPVAE